MIDLGTYQAGAYRKGYNYQYFLPSLVNDQWSWKDNSINLLLEKAAIKIGELNSFACLVPSTDLFIQLLVAKEAVISSRIEGTQTNIKEAFLPQEEVKPERRNDWQEVYNYIHALNKAIEELDTLPISARLIKQTHNILLNSVRGENKLPGEFRQSQNWIGGGSLADAQFIPPHHRHVTELMSDLEKFIHNRDINVPSLIRIAIAHYQFETIHPFLDGNGRIGRLIIPLFLVSEGILEKPLLYLSSYFERNKSLYYDNLTFVRTKNDMIQWLKYFLVGIEQTASHAVDTLTKVIQLKTEQEALIVKSFGRRSNNAISILHKLFVHPIINVSQAAIHCDISYKAANALISLMVEHNIIHEMTGQSRNRTFIIEAYLNLFESD